MQQASAIKSLLFIWLLVLLGCASNKNNAAFKFDATSPMPNGAWSKQSTVDGKDVTEVLVFVDGYFSHTAFETGSGAFLMTLGGSYIKDGLNLNVHMEFNSADATQVGKDEQWAAQIKGKELMLSAGTEQATWKPIDVGQKTELTGAWLFSGRERNGEMQRRDTNRPRKTMKLLTGTRFQWIAFHTETGQFSGTGGGEYSAENGKYIEKIGFFSRDDNRVGAELPFEFERKSADWHHKGKSSKGDPMYEIWSTRTN